jgi:NAD(P)-dependent dehydrogenase (short-subunit alcohol dehydrogenase family)
MNAKYLQKLEADREKAAHRVAFVTGAASGMGLGIAQHLARAGHPVVMTGLQKDLLNAGAAELAAEGCRVLAIEVDVADRSAVEAAIQAGREAFGPYAIVITSAGVTATTPFAELTMEQWDRVIAINLTGTFNSIQPLIGDLVAAGWGRIVTISSSSAQSGAMNRANYVASKGGVIGLTKALSMEYAPLGITVNTIPPSIVDTPMARDPASQGRGLDAVAAITPVRRVGTPDDIGAMCLYLCSDDGGFITGQEIGVNGGLYV